ncbi:MAG: nucleotidyltransferase domain-containing protein [Candidatus Sungbacteria bacterium]|nr:nucleotidyltransferase domain-containing protein [Candidatus Sungbacteria bacterium]
MLFPIQKKPIPADRLRQLGVAVLYLFGSHAEGLATSASDIDVGVLFSRNALPLPENKTELYNALYDVFTDVFDMSGFRDIDIVFLDRVPLELRFDVITHGQVLFETDPDIRLDFEERVAALYRDFMPLLNEFNRGVLQRI